MLKVLFADDHIPDMNVPESELTAHYLRVIQERFHEWPYTDAAFRDRAIRGYPAMLQAFKGLKSDNFDVVCANTLDDARKLAQTDKFDIAIVDLGWFLDPAVSSAERESAGWGIVDDIGKADRQTGRETACIIYSSRLLDDPRIVAQAAQHGLLPVLKYIEGDKSPVDVAVDSLRAAVSYLGAVIEQATPEKALQRRVREIECWLTAAADEALRNLRRWSAIISVAFVASLALIGVGIVLALVGRTGIGIVTSVTSTITAVFSRLARPLYKEAQRNVTETQRKLEEEIKKLRSVSQPTKAAV